MIKDVKLVDMSLFNTICSIFNGIHEESEEKTDGEIHETVFE